MKEGRPPGVLVIDDDADFRSLLAMVIEGNGMTPFVAEDCKAGLDMLSRERDRVSLVIVDYAMPRMSPTECLAAIRLAVRPQTRVVLCTAAVDVAARAAEVGVTQWLAKPFDYDDLQRILAVC